MLVHQKLDAITTLTETSSWFYSTVECQYFCFEKNCFEGRPSPAGWCEQGSGKLFPIYSVFARSCCSSWVQNTCWNNLLRRALELDLQEKPNMLEQQKYKPFRFLWWNACHYKKKQATFQSQWWTKTRKKEARDSMARDIWCKGSCLRSFAIICNNQFKLAKKIGLGFILRWSRSGGQNWPDGLHLSQVMLFLLLHFYNLH